MTEVGGRRSEGGGRRAERGSWQCSVFSRPDMKRRDL